MKDLYIEELERLAGLYEEQGMGEDEARAEAEANAYDAMPDRLADMADRDRMWAEEAEDRRRDNPLEPDFRRLGQ